MVDSWGGPTLADRSGVTIAAATSTSAIILHATGWPDAVAQAEPGKAEIALAMVAAIEGAATPENSERIRCALAVLLGQAGVEAQCADAKRIAECGGWPLCVALFERQQSGVTVLVTTVTVQARTLH